MGETRTRLVSLWEGGETFRVLINTSYINNTMYAVIGIILTETADTWNTGTGDRKSLLRQRAVVCLTHSRIGYV